MKISILNTLRLNNFFSPLFEFSLKDKPNHSRALAFGIIVIVLVALKMTVGDVVFFDKYFGAGFEIGELLNWYKWLYHFLATFFLFAILPFAFIKFFLKEKFSEYGISFGDWKYGMKATLAAVIFLPVLIYFASKNSEHSSFYPLTKLALKSPQHFALWGLSYLPHYIGLEFFLRGFICLGMRKNSGTLRAISIQALISIIMHAGKPTGEAWAAIAGSIYLALLTYRTNSVIWAIIFHWYLGMVNTYICGI